MQRLQALIDLLTKNRGIHISILDLSGVLSTPSTKISFDNVIHSKKFCDIAKSTARGYRACLRCKRKANQKAVNGKKCFMGHCYFGLYEAAYPIVMDERVLAIVYVGNAIVDEPKTRERIQKSCQYTGVDQSALLAQTAFCERLDDGKELMQIAEIVGDYLKLLYEKEPPKSTSYHWLVTALKRHADKAYQTSLTLKHLASIYHKNEKYMGRLFKKEVGVDFHEYCLDLRLKRAEELLQKTTHKIIDVAMESGFDNISYFNRAFMKRNAISPTMYRVLMKKDQNK